MNISIYFLIGFSFTVFIEILLNSESIKKHPKMIGLNWGWNERIICVLFWPICFIVFFHNFLKSYFE